MENINLKTSILNLMQTIDIDTIVCKTDSTLPYVKCVCKLIFQAPGYNSVYDWRGNVRGSSDCSHT